MSKEREVSGKIISTDDACNWNLTVAALKDYDHVYVNGIRYTEYQPEQPEQTEQEDIRDVWQDGYEAGLRLAKREPLSDGEITKNTANNIPIGEKLAFHAGIRWAEKHHGIGGEE